MDLHALRALTPGEPVPVGRLAQRIYCDPPNIVKVVTRLEGRGLVFRTRDESDARVRQVELTREGERLSAHVIDAFAVPPSYISDLAAPEQRALRELLARMPGS